MTNTFMCESTLPKPTPNFDNLLAVLRCEPPSRPTLFEFFLNQPLYRRLIAGMNKPLTDDAPGWLVQMTAFIAAGYDYATFGIPNFGFASERDQHNQKTLSLNEGFVITDRASFDAYAWPDPKAADYALLDEAAEYMVEGMKLVVNGPGGVLENVIQLVGYENLCFMIMDDEQLVYDVFEKVGSGLNEYYKRAVAHPAVGACISNDDWGFKSQTMLAPADMRRFVFTWHKQIAETVHAAGKPVILHSCGYFDDIIDDVIDDMKYDGRHSYEDTIMPVEKAYEQFDRRIAVLGGIDLDFICRHDPQEVYERSKLMVELGQKGGFALGTGNSVPEYIPDDGYFAMIQAALESR